MARRGAAALVAAALFTIAGNAGAYCRAKACDTFNAYDDVWQSEPDPPCQRDPVDCLLEGQPLHWPATCISFDVQKDGSADDGIDVDTATEIIEKSFATWQAADCGDGPPSIVVKNLGPVTCGRNEYNETQPNQNVFFFNDVEWVHDPAALALTWLKYNTETAEIYNADVEINSFARTLTVTDAPVVSDLQSILTHEIGHFLGLGHSLDRTAVMRRDYSDGSIEQRSLTLDDELGICEIYPPGRKVGGRCEPRHGFSRTCSAGADEGCNVTASPSGSATPRWIVVGLAALVAARRRRVSSKRPARPR